MFAAAARLGRSWRSTPTVWYAIPTALGALVLVAINQIHKASPVVSQQDKVIVGEGENVRLKAAGPWQVHVLGALPLRSLSRVWGYLNELQLPVCESGARSKNLGNDAKNARSRVPRPGIPPIRMDLWRKFERDRSA